LPDAPHNTGVYRVDINGMEETQFYKFAVQEAANELKGAKPDGSLPLSR